ncbi:MAG: DNA primase [Planctomycetes bacterium]|nr:DNA primase [Planctomycetota bacterium]
MGQLIPEERILEVQQANDIVDIISEYLPLRKSGSGYKALCPFHDEKTPSFLVSPAKQIYHCFGCHKGGNVFTFVMAFEKVNFIEAVKILAEKSGIRLITNPTPQEDYNEKKRATYLKINHWATDYFHKKLSGSDEGEAARAYLAKRGFKQGTIGRFLLGYAPEGWDNLLRASRQDKIKEDHLAELGLILPRKEREGYYDRFRNRLMFPIFNSRDRVVGFGGRALDDTEPVYLNSPESAIFSKGKTLYGLNFAKESADKKGLLCIVEGYTDVMMAHQAGLEWVVATLGTALTEHHIKLLRRFVNKVVLVYDADIAGEKASARTLDMFLSEELDLNIAELPKGLDPYDCIVQKGANVFARAIDQAKDLFSYRMASIRNKYDLNNLDEKAKAIDEVLEMLSLIPNIVKRNLLIKRLAEETQTKENVLRLRLAEREKQKKFAYAPAPKETAVRKTNSAGVMALRNIIEMMIINNDTINKIRKNLISEDFSSPPYVRIITEIFRVYDKYGKVELDTLLSVLSDDPACVNEVIEVTERNIISDKEACREHLDEQIEFFSKQRRQSKEIPLLKKELKETLCKGDDESFRNAQKKYLELRKSLLHKVRSK